MAHRSRIHIVQPAAWALVMIIPKPKFHTGVMKRMTTIWIGGPTNILPVLIFFQANIAYVRQGLATQMATTFFQQVVMTIPMVQSFPTTTFLILGICRDATARRVDIFYSLSIKTR
jgi:hypothetical protein